ncbi:MAG: sensor histidine kinase, partial [Acidobacteria bacterium]|nr:sensor histidine kinase [Acidobacteriota bacterium]
EVNTASVVGEQLLVARLLNEVQAEQDTQTAVLHQLMHKRDTLDREDLLKRLEDTDLALDRAAASSASSPEAARWAALRAKAKLFSADARKLLSMKGELPNMPLDRLFENHDEVVELVHELLVLSGSRVSAAENSIEAESKDLAQQSSWLLGASFGLALLCAAVTILYIRWSIHQMQWQASELNKVSWHMLQSQEAAARRFSHELHDELGQSLAAVKANLLALDNTQLEDRKQDCLSLVDEAIANVRELSQLLRPVILDDFGLEAGLRWLTEKFAQRTGLELQFDSNLPGRLPDETETHLFRIAQEALTNIARHSGATKVIVSLKAAENKVWLRIADNGRGLDATAAKTSSVGLTGMRARASQAGGELTLNSLPSGGVQIEAWVPTLQPENYVEQENAHLIG